MVTGRLISCDDMDSDMLRVWVVAIHQASCTAMLIGGPGYLKYPPYTRMTSAYAYNSLQAMRELSGTNVF